MQTEQNKALYRRFIEEGFNQGRLETLDEVLAPGYRDHDAPPGTPPGPAGIKQIVLMYRGAFPDMHITIEHQVAEGDTVCSRLSFRGTHRGPLFGMPATDRSVTMSGLTMIRIANGALQEGWVKNDVLGLFEQLGVSPTGSPATA